MLFAKCCKYLAFLHSLNILKGVAGVLVSKIVFDVFD